MVYTCVHVVRKIHEYIYMYIMKKFDHNGNNCTCIRKIFLAIFSMKFQVSSKLAESDTMGVWVGGSEGLKCF